MSAADMAIPAFVAVERPLCDTGAGAAEMPGSGATDFLVLEAMMKLLI